VYRDGFYYFGLRKRREVEYIYRYLEEEVMEVTLVPIVEG
jgi:hypothetical protein